MRKSRESRWACKTPSELLRCSSVGKAAAQSAEPDQESSAAVSALRRRRRIGSSTRGGGSSSFGNLQRHPVNFTPLTRPCVLYPLTRCAALGPESASTSRVSLVLASSTYKYKH